MHTISLYNIFLLLNLNLTILIIKIIFVRIQYMHISCSTTGGHTIKWGSHVGWKELIYFVDDMQLFSTMADLVVYTSTNICSRKIKLICLRKVKLHTQIVYKST